MSKNYLEIVTNQISKV